MKQITFVIFLSFFFAICARKCPKNEVFNSCGTACEPNCHFSPILCTDQCVAKCFCRNGYIRLKPKGKCVPTSKCQCGRNEEFKLGVPQCQKSCEPMPGICETILFLNDYGCFCKEGFIRKTSQFSECIEMKDCLRK
jgi:hypothetical protein